MITRHTLIQNLSCNICAFLYANNSLYFLQNYLLQLELQDQTHHMTFINPTYWKAGIATPYPLFYSFIPLILIARGTCLWAFHLQEHGVIWHNSSSFSFVLVQLYVSHMPTQLWVKSPNVKCHWFIFWYENNLMEDYFDICIGKKVLLNCTNLVCIIAYWNKCMLWSF